MPEAFLGLFIASFICLVIGLIKPGLVVRWGSKRTRSRALLYYGLGMVVSFVLIAVTIPKPEQRASAPSVSLIAEEEQAPAAAKAQPSTTPAAPPATLENRPLRPGDVVVLGEELGIFDQPKGQNIAQLKPGQELKILAVDLSKGLGWYEVEAMPSGPKGWASALWSVEPKEAAATRTDITHQGLRPGFAFQLKKSVSLMPALKPVDYEKALAQVVSLPAGTQVKVLKVGDANGTPWYKVAAGGRVGWINSIALMGQL